MSVHSMPRGRIVAAAAVVATFALMPRAASALPPIVLANYPIFSAPQSWKPDHLHLGAPIVAIGDVDGNGIIDLAVGASGDAEGGPESGAVVILFMDEQGTVGSYTKIGPANAPLAIAPGDEFGTSLAALGDINHDGVVDLAVGAAADDDGAVDSGSVWILTLTSTGSVASAAKIGSQSAGVAASYDRFGASLAAVGDLDGNGMVDLAIGAPGFDEPEFNAGVVRIALLDNDRTLKQIAALGGLEASMRKRGGFGSTLSTIGGELFVGALGDGSSFAPPGEIRAVHLGAGGQVETERRFLPSDDSSLVPDGAVVRFGDYDFDGVADLIASTTSGLRIVFLDEDGSIRDTAVAGGEWPDVVRCCGSHAQLVVLPDADGNAIPEIVASSEPFLSSEVWMLQLNGISPEGAACGDPTGEGVVTAADALLVLRAAVGLRFCEALWCDVDASGRITAADALSELRRAIASEGFLACPTTSTTTSTTYIYYDECFWDEDCSWNPDESHCCYFECCECRFTEDCEPGRYCDGETCRAATCYDGETNGDETGVDCGGSCNACSAGSGCETNADCYDGACASGTCHCATCSDELSDGGETGVDCGGDVCDTCGEYQGCERGSDCASRVCHQACAPATCDDRTRNGTETGVDCGGSCPPCASGKACGTHADCANGVCLGGVCQVATCSDAVRNGTETGIDCGGSTCSPCRN